MKVCPECDTSDMWATSGDARGTDAEHRYRCTNGHTFDAAATRERRGGENLKGLAAKLERIDPDE
jgi:hypothetical protein